MRLRHTRITPSGHCTRRLRCSSDSPRCSARLALRIGVNTGDVVVGRPREGSRLSPGDAVNVGARLEQAARAGEILVGERTVAAVRGAFEFGERDDGGRQGETGRGRVPAGLYARCR